MIVIAENKGPINVLHLIIGDESSFPLDFQGFIAGDITNQVKMLASSDKPIMIHINYCDSEQQLSEHMEYLQSQNLVSSILKNDKSDDNDGKTGDKQKQKVSHKCPKCGGPSGYVIDDIPQICKKCVQIDSKLDIPTDEELNKLINQGKDSNIKGFLSKWFSKK